MVAMDTPLSIIVTGSCLAIIGLFTGVLFVHNGCKIEYHNGFYYYGIGIAAILPALFYCIALMIKYRINLERFIG